MNDHKTVSMQESTTGAVDQFLSMESLQCLQSIRLLSYLAGALQRYEEEGVLLNPRVILCRSVDDFSKSFPGGKNIKVGEADYLDDCGKRILKECATLARNGWIIYVERSSAERVSFGVLSFLESPTSIDLRDMIAISSNGVIDKKFNAVLIERIDPKTVLMTGASGSSLRVAFSTTRKAADDADAAEKFASSCSAECTVEGFADYFCAFFQRALSESHGTIVVCLPQGSIGEIDGMADAIVFEPAIDLAEIFGAYKTANSAESILELQRVEGLLASLFHSDGIVVFDTKGRACAFRVFYRPPQSKASATASLSSTASAPVGGARRRAFEGVKAHVGNDKQLKAALFRSQDGLTEFVGA